MTKKLLHLGMAAAFAALPLALTGPVYGAEASTGSPAGPCADVVVPLGSACVPSPKQCFTTPCYQYDIVPLLPSHTPWPPPERHSIPRPS
ncbi:hypothetical protein AB0N93_29750 [Streptomyces sp. NPDC091267]|uniref:hypothetical protein n=1 Tax=Streptomyces sp. NPDC091267 TaxID=3155195 RepID=UPI00342FA14F